MISDNWLLAIGNWLPICDGDCPADLAIIRVAVSAGEQHSIALAC